MLKKYKPFYNFSKRIIDIVGSILGIIIFSPIFILVPILIKLDSKGPVVHKRKVSGKNDNHFYFYKFRTMVNNADKVIKEWKNNRPELYEKYTNNIKLEKDPRVTRVGKILRNTSLDEITQFFNVLKGEMSLVGPRPIVDKEKEKYPKRFLEQRLSIKPGITGYWQVNGKNEVDYNERIEMDKYYLENRSLWLDFKIILKTIWVFFIKGKNS